MQPDELRVQKPASILKAIISPLYPRAFHIHQRRIYCDFQGKKELFMKPLTANWWKRTGILMEGNAPHGGKWNYDAQTERSFQNHLIPPHLPSTNVEEVYVDVLKAELPTIGNQGSQHYWPTSSSRHLAYSISGLNIVSNSLEIFKMQWPWVSGAVLYRISVLNVKLIDPLTICQRAEAYYRSNEHIPLNAAEGFIRQILGWRYYERRLLGAHARFWQRELLQSQDALPEWSWT